MSFSRELIVDTLARCLPEAQPGQPERNWRRYAERITAYAFGVMGDVQLAHGAASRAAEKREQQELANEARQMEAARPALRMRWLGMVLLSSLLVWQFSHISDMPFCGS